MKETGYTLIELVIVFVIIGVMAGLAVIYGNRPLEVAHGRSARAVLQAIHAAEREFCIHNNVFTDLGDELTPGTLIGDAYLDDPDFDQQIWDFDATAVPDPNPNACGTFTATATRVSGVNVGEDITLDETGQFGGSWDPYF